MQSNLTKISEIATIYDGPHATPTKLDKGNYFLSISSLDKGRLDLSKSAFISDEDFKKWTRRVTPTEGDLLFSYETRLGEVALMPKDLKACLGRRMGLLRPDTDKVVPEYLLYAYLSPEFQNTIVKNTITGATVDRIALNEMGDFPIRIPPIEEQKAVASLLSNLDEKIALNNQINATLEQMAKTLYDYWFVQFDFPDDNGKPYKSSGGEMVYNETLKRDIPKGWEVKEIQDFCRIFTGKKDVNQASEMGQYKFFSCAPNFKYSNEKLFEGKAILVSGNGSYTGRTIFVNDAFDLYQRTYAVVSKTDLDVLEYIFYSMLRSFVPKVSGGTHGSAIPYIVFNDIAKETILFHENVVDRFMHIIINIQKQVIDLSEQNYKLTEMRDWLLPMLMNGQVTVQ